MEDPGPYGRGARESAIRQADRAGRQGAGRRQDGLGEPASEPASGRWRLPGRYIAARGSRGPPGPIRRTRRPLFRRARCGSRAALPRSGTRATGRAGARRREKADLRHRAGPRGGAPAVTSHKAPLMWHVAAPPASHRPVLVAGLAFWDPARPSPSPAPAARPGQLSGRNRLLDCEPHNKRRPAVAMLSSGITPTLAREREALQRAVMRTAIFFFARARDGPARQRRVPKSQGRPRVPGWARNRGQDHRAIPPPTSRHGNRTTSSRRRRYRRKVRPPVSGPGLAERGLRGERGRWTGIRAHHGQPPPRGWGGGGGRGGESGPGHDEPGARGSAADGQARPKGQGQAERGAMSANSWTAGTGRGRKPAGRRPLLCGR